ncbi:glucosamine inositolphosphorylceramide transferase family protein [Agrobacterium sp. ES01]|uniref:glucosamine inositolphosphorylceramide transferase family protein n=1 Tax=Agrobacterium sp. ES01 TaxID=3420714 RepID=UPI003D0B6D3A
MVGPSKPVGINASHAVAAALRIAVLVDRQDRLENWQLRIIDRILEDDRFCLVSVPVCQYSNGRTKASLLFRFVSAMERAIVARQPKYVPRHFNLSDLPFEPFCKVFRGKDEPKLDLVLCLAGGALDDTEIRRMRHGEWHFSFTRHADAVADWFGYAGSIEKTPTTKVRIEVRRPESSQREILASAAFNTKFSAIRNGDFIKERAVTLVMRELRRVANNGSMHAVANAPNAEPAEMPPTACQLALYSMNLSRVLFVRAVEAVKLKLGTGPADWRLYVGEGYGHDFDPHKAVPAVPGDDEFRADPFLLEYSGQLYIFYEAFSPGETKAHIAVSRLVGNRLERLGIALECDHHLSYPFIFRHDDQLFMIPEAHQARRLEVWRCVDFPLGWELYSTGLEGFAPADSALTHFDGKWWLFTNLSDFHAYEDHCSELHVFEVDGPELKRIVPHKNNPVVIDSTVARNGGRPFEHEGKLYRPSQRNEHGIYGYALNIMEVEHLDLETYRERCVRTITPDFGPGQVACHHLDAAAGRFVIDVMFEG